MSELQTPAKAVRGRHLALIAGASCAACCALPVLVATGFGGLMSAIALELGGERLLPATLIGMALLASIVLIVLRARRRARSSSAAGCVSVCHVDHSCGDSCRSTSAR
jgi:hypothetical protein